VFWRLISLCNSNHLGTRNRAGADGQRTIDPSPPEQSLSLDGFGTVAFESLAKYSLNNPQVEQPIAHGPIVSPGKTHESRHNADCWRRERRDPKDRGDQAISPGITNRFAIR